MRKTRLIIDIVQIILVALVVYIAVFKLNIIITVTPNEFNSFSKISDILSTIISGIVSTFGMLISAFLISSQLIKRSPYSRFNIILNQRSSLIFFFIFTISSIYSILVFSKLNTILYNQNLYLIDISLLLFIISILSCLSLLLAQVAVLSDKLVCEKVLEVFNIRNIKKYGLLSIHTNENNIVKYKLKTWGHRHNLADPLGAFHDLLMETIKNKERITMHKYLSLFMDRIAFLNNVPFKRNFGLAGGDRKKNITIISKKIHQIRGMFNKKEHKVQATIHGLHYLVRRCKKLIQEWEMDNHRQIFIINIADFILSLCKYGKNNGQVIDVCLFAILRISEDYKDVKRYGSYEPLKDLFELSSTLKKHDYNKQCNLCIEILAYLDRSSNYLSWNEKIDLNSLPTEIRVYFDSVREQTSDKLRLGFRDSIWLSS